MTFGDKNHPWQRKKKPLVTECCGSLNWSSRWAENPGRGVEFCNDCKVVTHIQPMTLEQYNKYNIAPVTQEHFESLWEQKQDYSI